MVCRRSPNGGNADTPALAPGSSHRPRGIGPRAWQIRARAQLLSETADLAEQMRCLKAILALDPDLDHARVVPVAEGGSGVGPNSLTSPVECQSYVTFDRDLCKAESRCGLLEPTPFGGVRV
jgi:hypothetical protein